MICFVTMPFAEEFNNIKTEIKKSVTNSGYEYVRADEYYSSGKITEQIIQMIEKSDICICDLTNNNPNVIWELGYAYAKQKIIVLIAQSTDDLFFDIKIDRAIIYDKDKLSISLTQKLDLFLSESKKRIKEKSIEDYYYSNPYKKYSQVIGANNLQDTPWDFFNLVKRAKNHIFLAAQNHYFFVRKENKKLFKDTVKEFLSKNKANRMEIMLCSDEKKYSHAVKTWQYVTIERYKEDLEESVIFFRELQDECNKDRKISGQLFIHKVEFVPFSITFIDPNDENGILVFTPNAYEEKNIKRPCFALSKKKNNNIYQEYWAPYRQRFEDIKYNNI